MKLDLDTVAPDAGRVLALAQVHAVFQKCPTRNTGKELTMRAEFATAVGHLLEAVPPTQPLDLSDACWDELVIVVVGGAGRRGPVYHAYSHFRAAP